MAHPITPILLQEKLAEIRRLFPVGTVLTHSSGAEIKVRGLDFFNVVEPVADLPCGICYGAKYVWFASSRNGWNGEFVATVKEAAPVKENKVQLRELVYSDGERVKRLVVNTDQAIGSIEVTDEQWDQLKKMGVASDELEVASTRAAMEFILS